MRWRYWLAGLAGGCLAQAAQSLAEVLWAIPPLSTRFVLAHFSWLLLLNLALALFLGGRREDRAWAAAAFFLPVAMALLPVQAVHPSHRFLVLIGLVLGLVGWSWLPLGPGAPLATAYLGSLLAAALTWFRLLHFKGFHTSPRPIALIAACAAVTLGLSLAAGKLARRLHFASSLVYACAALTAGLAIWSRTPSLPSAPRPTARDGSSAPSIVVIVLDTVRASHLAHYGYARNTMPNLERFAAEEAVSVDEVVAESSWTVPTHASLFTGLYPPRHGAGIGPLPSRVTDLRPLRAGLPTLAQILEARGYWTVGIVANFAALSPEHGFNRGFHHYEAWPSPEYQARLRSPWTLVSRGRSPLEALDSLHGVPGLLFSEGVSYRRAGSITDRALAVLAQAGDRPFFLFANFMDAHWPYSPPQPFDRRYARPGLLSTSEFWKRGVFDGVLSGQRDLTKTEQDSLTALYDGSLSYLDSELKRLLAGLARHPRWKDMILVVTADHGEAFGEHRLVLHERRLYEDLVRVPLFIKPGPRPLLKGSRVPGPMQLVDVFATTLELAGVPLPENIDGTAWGSGRTRAFSWVSPDQIARRYPERFDRELRAVREDGWKLIESRPGGLELFDLRSDPLELRNLAETELSRRDAALKALGPAPDWPHPSARESPGVRALSREREEELRALGYLQ